MNIYALINPLNDSVFYIGATQSPQSRLYAHNSRGKGSGNSKKNNLIRIIKSFGMKAEMVILDEVDDEHTRFWEEFYIELFTSYGFVLLQRKTSLYSLYTYNHRPPNFSKESEDTNGLDTYVISGCCQGEEIEIKLSQKSSKIFYTDLKDKLYEMYDSRVNSIKEKNKNRKIKDIYLNTY